MTNDTIPPRCLGPAVRFVSIAVGTTLAVLMGLAPSAAFALCADDAVLVGGALCVDKYEASVWSLPPGGVDPGTQYGLESDDYPCAHDGQNCNQIYAASVPDMRPSVFVTWFQAQQACANVGKRLLTNAEWQLAATGPSGSADPSVSRWGALQMAGSAEEFVADWVPSTRFCSNWGDISDDIMCFAGVNEQLVSPGVLNRGGTNEDGAQAGPLAIFVDTPIAPTSYRGFRCARPSS